MVKITQTIVSAVPSHGDLRHQAGHNASSQRILTCIHLYIVTLKIVCNKIAFVSKACIKNAAKLTKYCLNAQIRFFLAHNQQVYIKNYSHLIKKPLSGWFPIVWLVIFHLKQGVALSKCFPKVLSLFSILFSKLICCSEQLIFFQSGKNKWKNKMTHNN
jgi:hypothetical protein